MNQQQQQPNNEQKQFASQVDTNRDGKQIATDFLVKMPDTFNKTAPRKFIHFFQNDDTKLHLIDLDRIEIPQRGRGINEKLKFTTIDLKIQFKIPSFHKSIANSNSDLYLTGGTLLESKVNKSGQIYQYDWASFKLVPLGCMNFPRSSHGISILKNWIYVVGGYEHSHIMTKRCERFNMDTKQWQVIAPLTHAATSLSLCSQGDRYLFKFGGIGEGKDNHMLNPFIERYDSMKDQWQVIDPQISQVCKLNQGGFSFSLLSTCASIQISQNLIFVFGGYHEDNSGSNQSFLLQIAPSSSEIKSETTCNLLNPFGKDNNAERNQQFFIKHVNQKILPCPEAFWNNVPVIFNNKIYVLQNISGENSDNCLENHRKILVFDSNEWLQLN